LVAKCDVANKIGAALVLLRHTAFCCVTINRCQWVDGAAGSLIRDAFVGVGAPLSTSEATIRGKVLSAKTVITFERYFLGAKS